MGDTPRTSIITAGTMSYGTTASNLEAVQSSGTHVGTPSSDFTLAFGSYTVSFRSGVPFIADAALYAAVNASPVAAANIAWAD
jgi:hypothetical protein